MNAYALGVDVGGTKIAAGLVTPEGRIIRELATGEHSERSPDTVIEKIDELCAKLIEESSIDRREIRGAALGFAGTVDGPRGIVLVSSNLPRWDHYPLRDRVEERLGLPVLLDNDTNLCALGEHRYGAGRGTSNMCYVTFSTGIGLGVIIGGSLYLGATGTAGELAHVVVEVHGPPCTCGKNGCLMAFASGVGISRMAYEALRSGEETMLWRIAPADGTRFRGEEVAEVARRGDAAALRILKTAGYYCGVGLSIVVECFNPDLIVLGGGLTYIGELVMDHVTEGLRENTQPQLLPSLRLLPWELKESAGILGAAAKVFSEL